MEGRTKLRPIIVEEEICEEEEVREICSQTFRQRAEWSKRCSMPADMKLELMEQILLNAEPGEPGESGENEIDRITFRNKTDRSRQESKIVRLKVPAQRGQDRIRSNVNFQFVSETSTSRPGGFSSSSGDSLGDSRDQRGETRDVGSPRQPDQTRPTNVGLPVQPWPADTRRYAGLAGRFPVRPAPVSGLAGTKHWRSRGGERNRASGQVDGKYFEIFSNLLILTGVYNKHQAVLSCAVYNKPSSMYNLSD